MPDILAKLRSLNLSDPRNVRLLFDYGRSELSLPPIYEARDHATRIATTSTYQTALEAYELVRQINTYLAPVDFDAYCLALESHRPAAEQFYLPRRAHLQPIVQGIQDLLDDRLDELFISQPPRTGKTTLLLFLLTYIIAKHPDLANLYSAYSDLITNAMYRGVLEIIGDPSTYAWNEIFPTATVANTNAQEETLNINRKKRYSSLTCRSLYGTLNGACDANGFLISDDLLSGIEEALSPDRLTSAWTKVDNNLLTRAKKQCKVLWCGTRWSLYDPIGKRLSILEGNPEFAHRRYRVVNIPALNEDDESNFNYLYNVGFDTRYYRERRASFEANDDIASWNAQYMGQPIEREGVVFSPGSLRYYNGTLPDGDPQRIFMAVDPAWGGGDYVAAPVIYKYDGLLYVHDVVYSNEDKSVTQPLLAQAIINHNVQAVQVEASKMTMDYAEGVNEILKSRNYRVNMMTKPASSTAGSKEQRIFDKGPDIRSTMIFRDRGYRSKPYEMFMQNVFSFKITGKNKHDDAPDSLAMAIDMDLETGYGPRIRNPLW